MTLINKGLLLTTPAIRSRCLKTPDQCTWQSHKTKLKFSIFSHYSDSHVSQKHSERYHFLDTTDFQRHKHLCNLIPLQITSLVGVKYFSTSTSHNSLQRKSEEFIKKNYPIIWRYVERISKGKFYDSFSSIINKRGGGKVQSQKYKLDLF